MACCYNKCVMTLYLNTTGTFMVVWKKDTTLISAGSTKVIRDSRISIVGTSLDIAKVSNKDSGNYTCEINTDVPSHINIVLNVLGEPYFRIPSFFFSALKVLTFIMVPVVLICVN